MAQTYTDKPTLAAWNAVESAVAEKCEIVFGSYTGDGTQIRTIDLGFTPKWVLLFDKYGYSTTGGLCHGGLATQDCPLENPNNLDPPCLTIVNGGIRLNAGNSGNNNSQVNKNRLRYQYLAGK